MEKPTSKSKNTNKSNKPSINENLFAKGWKYDENGMLTRNDAIDLKSANIDIKNEIKAPFEKKKSFHERKLNAINKKPLSLKDKPYTAKKKSPSRRKKG